MCAPSPPCSSIQKMTVALGISRRVVSANVARRATTSVRAACCHAGVGVKNVGGGSGRGWVGAVVVMRVVFGAVIVWWLTRSSARVGAVGALQAASTRQARSTNFMGMSIHR